MAATIAAYIDSDAMPEDVGDIGDGDRRGPIVGSLAGATCGCVSGATGGFV